MELHDAYTAEGTEKDLEQLTIRSLKKGLQMAEDFGASHFMVRFQKLDHEMEVVMAVCDKVYKDINYHVFLP